VNSNEQRILKLRVLLNGRPLKSYKFNKPVVIIGRDPTCDVVLDNTGVSRQHVKIELSPTGYYSVIDLESANGSQLRGEPLKKNYLINNDTLQVAKFTILVNLEGDQRNQAEESRLTPASFSNTTVLSTDDLLAMEIKAREKLKAAPIPLPEPAPRARFAWSRQPFFWAGVIVAFMLGSAVGAWAHWLLAR
jgi:pSer/pThr/pTyr-binding forkhead associated (FHA) protein